MSLSPRHRPAGRLARRRVQLRARRTRPKHRIFFADFRAAAARAARRPRGVRHRAREAALRDRHPARALRPARGLRRRAARAHRPLDALPVQGRRLLLDVGRRRAENAVWAYEDPLPEAAWLQRLRAPSTGTGWTAGSSRRSRSSATCKDPFHRVDVHESSRPVTVRAGGRRRRALRAPEAAVRDRARDARLRAPRRRRGGRADAAPRSARSARTRARRRYWSLPRRDRGRGLELRGAAARGDQGPGPRLLRRRGRRGRAGRAAGAAPGGLSRGRARARDPARRPALDGASSDRRHRLRLALPRRGGHPDRPDRAARGAGVVRRAGGRARSCSPTATTRARRSSSRTGSACRSARRGPACTTCRADRVRAVRLRRRAGGRHPPARDLGDLARRDGARDPRAIARSRSPTASPTTTALGFFPDYLLGDDPEAEKQRLRDGFARLAAEVDFDHLLLAHGTPILGDGRERLRRFAAG